MFVIGIIIYFLFILFVGIYSGRYIKDSESYLVANRKLPSYIVVPTIVATWFGAGTCLGVSGMVYKHGFDSVIADPFATSIGLLIAGLFFAYPFRKQRLLTVADIIGKVYSKPLEVFSAVLMIPFFIGTLASQMIALGYIFNITMGVQVELGIAIGTIVVLLYTIAGGMWAVSLTDCIQMLFIVIALVILLVITCESLTDITPVLQLCYAEIKTLAPKKNSFHGSLSYIGKFLMVGLGAIMGQDLIQRFLSSKSANVARYSTISAGFIYFVLGAIPLFIGLAGRFIYPELENAETLIPYLASQKLSPALFGIFAAGLISAIMSTADSYLLAGTSIFTENILLNINPNISEKTHLFFTRLTNVIITTLAIILAFVYQNIFNLMVHSGALLFVCIFVPVTMALHWKKAKDFLSSAWTSMLLGLASWLLWIFFYGLSEENLFAAATVGGGMSLIGYIFPVIFSKRLKKIG